MVCRCEHQGRDGPRTTTVLHVVNGEHYAGAERVQDLLAQRLPALGYRVVFACLKTGKFQRQLETGDLPSALFAMNSRLDIIGTAKRVARFATAKGAELIHTHTARSALIGGIAARMSGLPFVHHVHSPTERDSTHWLLNRLNAQVERWSLARVRALIPVSGSLERHLVAGGYPADRITVVPNGVPLHPPRQRTQGQPFTMGMVALFRPRKGVEILLDAMARLRERGVETRLRLVGPFEESGYQHLLESRAARLGLADCIEWCGFQQNVFAQFEHMDLLVLPSLFGEGMPMVLLEAMSAGVPVVASRIEGIPELVRDGTDGFLAEAGDADELAAAVERCAIDPVGTEALGRQARARQECEFSDLVMAQRIASVYQRVLATCRETD